MRAFLFIVGFVSAVAGCQSPEPGPEGGGGEDPEQGGAGGTDVSDPEPDTSGPWGNSCDWCNGPGCEELDRPCQDVESGSRGVVCSDNDTLTAADHCFPTLDQYHWDRPVLCCCESGACQGV